MSVHKSSKQKLYATKNAIKNRPYVSLTIFVVIVVVVAGLGYARYQYIQEELAAQQTVLDKIRSGLDDWGDDLSKRVGDLKGGVQGTAKDAGNVVGGVWGIIKFVVTAILDYVGNLHIMIPVTIAYFVVGFFGTLKIRAATLVGSIIALWVATRTGIVPGSLLGLLAIAGLLFWNKINLRSLTAIQGLPNRLKCRIQQARDGSRGVSSTETGPTGASEDSRD